MTFVVLWNRYKNAPRALDWNKHNARSALNNELTVNSHGSVTEKGQPQEGRVLDLDEVDPGNLFYPITNNSSVDK